MSTGLYLFGSAGLVAIGLYGLIVYPHLLRKFLALNIMGSGVFMALLALASRDLPADPVPQALVLTGIVVAISAMALGLRLIRRLSQDSHPPFFEDSVK